MSCISDIVLPKTYKNGKILFEEDLDKWRLKSEETFNLIALNFDQIVKDCFSVGYQLDCDGNANLPVSLQDQILALQGGGVDLLGTSSDTFTINTDGNGATLDTQLLTMDQNYFFPDCSGTFMILECDQQVNGAKRFFPLALKLKASGGGAGHASLQFAFSGDDVDYTIPDVNTDGTFALLEGAQTFLGAKTFNAITTFSNNLIANATIFAQAAIAIDLVNLGNRIVLDADGDTSIRASADDTITIELNGVDKITINPNGELLLPDVDPPTANFSNRNGNIKCWGSVDAAGPTYLDSYNTSGNPVHVGLGNYRIDFNTPFANNDYAVVANAVENVTPIFVTISNVSPGSFAVKIYDDTGTLTDNDFRFIVIGTQ